MGNPYGLKMCVDALDPPVGAARQPGATKREALRASLSHDFAYAMSPNGGGGGRDARVPCN